MPILFGKLNFNGYEGPSPLKQLLQSTRYKQNARITNRPKHENHLGQFLYWQTSLVFQDAVLSATTYANDGGIHSGKPISTRLVEIVSRSILRKYGWDNSLIFCDCFISKTDNDSDNSSIFCNCFIGKKLIRISAAANAFSFQQNPTELYGDLRWTAWGNYKCQQKHFDVPIPRSATTRSVTMTAKSRQRLRM